MAGKKYTFKDGPYKRQSERPRLSWATVGENSLYSFVVKCTDLGYTVCFSRTSDGSSLSLTVMAGNEKIKEYIGSKDDALNVFQSILEYIDAS
jgi:hypothetical protein